MRYPATPPRRPRLKLLMALAATLATGAVLAESGTVLKATQLRNAPLGSSEVIAELKAKQSVQITARQGAWAGVTTEAGQEGWARVLNLRTGTGEASGASAEQLASVFRTGSSGTTVTTGVKGLSAEQLRSASPNYSEVDRLDEFAADAGDARQFASTGELEAQPVDYLKEPRRSGRQR